MPFGIRRLVRAAPRSGLTAGCVLLAVGCGAPSAEDLAHAGGRFRDRAADSGLVFVHETGGTGRFYFPEIMGAGGALFDYDNDGDLDAFLLQGHDLGPTASDQGRETQDRLFRNDLVPSGAGRSLTFTDVTDGSGIDGRGYGMGAAVGDYDNDGWPDLYTTAWGPNRLWRNRGPDDAGVVTFEDVTEETGTGDIGWGSSAAFVDIDRDGWLDLYVVNYVVYSLAQDVRCLSPSGRSDFCSPNSYLPAADRLFRNRGPGADGTVAFEDASRESGIAATPSNGLGIVTGDFDGDGWLDLYVANDKEPNFLWHNRGAEGAPGVFRNDALVSGCALNEAGMAEASMGVSAGDADNDGDEDLFMTHLKGETNTLFLNDGHGFFEDRTTHGRLGGSSLPATGFGAMLVDVDNDGDLDVVVVNGAVTTLEELALAGDPYPFGQPNQLYRNEGDAVFEDITAAAGEAFALAEVSRGAAVGDVDNDGDSDLLVFNNRGPARLLINEPAGAPHWLGLRLLTRTSSASGRDALGAWVQATLADGRTLRRRARTDSSYLSASDPRLIFGLGDLDSPVSLTVDWPSGLRESWNELVVDRYTTLIEGEGARLRSDSNGEGGE